MRAESRIPGTPTGPDQRPLAVCDEHQPGACTPGRCMLTAAAGAPTAYRISVLRPRSCCLPGRSDTLAGRHRMGTLHRTVTPKDDWCWRENARIPVHHQGSSSLAAWSPRPAKAGAPGISGRPGHHSWHCPVTSSPGGSSRRKPRLETVHYPPDRGRTTAPGRCLRSRVALRSPARVHCTASITSRSPCRHCRRRPIDTGTGSGAYLLGPITPPTRVQLLCRPPAACAPYWRPRSGPSRPFFVFWGN